MKRLVEFPLLDGNTVIIEVDEIQTETGVEPIANMGQIMEKAKDNLENAIEKIKPAISVFVNKLHEVAKKPDEINLEFGIKFNGKIGALIASSDVEANFKVSLKWIKHNE